MSLVKFSSTVSLFGSFIFIMSSRLLALRAFLPTSSQNFMNSLFFATKSVSELISKIIAFLSETNCYNAFSRIT